METRIQALRQQLQQTNLDALLITYPVNRRYLTGFSGSSGFALVTVDEQILITDFRYRLQSKQEAPEWSIVFHQDSIIESVVEQCQLHQIQSLAFEAEYVPYQMYRELKEALPDVQMKPVTGWIEQLRVVKSPQEIEQIRRATEIVDIAFTQLLEELRPGLTELQVASRIEALLREQGASSSSFETIVASGDRSALPHGRASMKTLEKGDFVILDFGAYFNGYASDITRTVVLGPASEKQKEVYQIVLEAQTKAIEAIAPGLMGKEIDQVARNWIVSKGYGDFFEHATGHGLGLEVHESPLLRRSSEEILQAGMVVTVEPGVYLPDFGGVRIEDDVLVTASGSEVLTTAPKHLIEIDC